MVPSLAIPHARARYLIPMPEVSTMTDRILRWTDVRRLIAVSRCTLKRWMKTGQFPAQRRFGPNSVGWLESEVQHWLAAAPKSFANDREDTSLAAVEADSTPGERS